MTASGIVGESSAGSLEQVLVVAYYFPPSNAPGVHRSLRYVRYLPRFGWQPVVLTVNKDAVWVRDDSLLALIPKDIQVYRTLSVEPVRTLSNVASLLRIRKGKQRYRDPRGLDSDNSKNETSISIGPGKALFRKTFNAIANLISVPDGQIGWLPFAIWVGYRVIRKNKIKLIYTTSQPWTALLVGMVLKRLTGLPWVADLRDGWTVPSGFHAPACRLNKSISRYLERFSMRVADLVVFTTVRTQETYLDHFSNELQRARTTVIYNGFDVDQVGCGGQVSEESEGPFVLSMVGTTREAHSLETFCTALSQVIRIKNLVPSQFCVRFVGDTYIGLFRLAEKLGLRDYITFTQRVSFDESTAAMGDSTVLLLPIGVVPGSPFTMPSKAFHYLMMGKPVLALAPLSSEVADLIHRAKAGIVVSPTDQDAICGAIVRLYEDYVDGRLVDFSPDLKFVFQFSGDKLTQKLAGEMDQLVKSKGRAN